MSLQANNFKLEQEFTNYCTQNMQTPAHMADPNSSKAEGTVDI